MGELPTGVSENDSHFDEAKVITYCEICGEEICEGYPLYTYPLLTNICDDYSCRFAAAWQHTTADDTLDFCLEEDRMKDFAIFIGFAGWLRLRSDSRIGDMILDGKGQNLALSYVEQNDVDYVDFYEHKHNVERKNAQ